MLTLDMHENLDVHAVWRAFLVWTALLRDDPVVYDISPYTLLVTGGVLVGHAGYMPRPGSTLESVDCDAANNNFFLSYPRGAALGFDTVAPEGWVFRLPWDHAYVWDHPSARSLYLIARAQSLHNPATSAACDIPPFALGFRLDHPSKLAPIVRSGTVDLRTPLAPRGDRMRFSAPVATLTIRTGPGEYPGPAMLGAQ